jgi:hypothetical protein
MEKTGRNDPCPCGSGKKYKKCCEARVENAERLARAAATSATRGDAAGAESHRESGPSAQMTAFAQPLFDETDGSLEQMNRAFQLAALFWNLALLWDDEERDRRVDDLLDSLKLEGQARADLARTARAMVARHRAMFPHLHRH